MTHVLVVDDDPGITRFFQRFFAQRGVATSSAHTVEEFNLQLEKEFHLALVDIRFGPVDGVQLINQITRKHPHCASHHRIRLGEDRRAGHESRSPGFYRKALHRYRSTAAPTGCLFKATRSKPGRG
ncbi:protein of unknown function [Kyrpidia spormannii]|uniref:Response regulatory domain-containing protein n=1 Tax=Kyrpidia spormannii TaxID=2055160 RepID=A0A6F9E6U9_9BACL|nr:protein of unknown function [Kyrpidia spormannii]